ncbi:MAG TPA: fasciclin domain-containing protein [Puia sp.]|nr:fasciclin domain-containing protein [Puia sp.]
MSNIVDVVVADKNLATMSRTVKAAGLETELSKQGPFTLFAPTDIAFGKLGEGELHKLLNPENQVKLKDLLNYHVVAGRTDFKDFKDGQKLKTLNGKQLDVKVLNGDVTINGSKLMGKDGTASNGIVHSLDKVLTVK